MGIPAPRIATPGFAAVDANPDPAFFIGYLDRIAAELRDVKHQLLELLGLAAGEVVLDVGCGTGDDVRAMARLVGPSGRAVGLDASRTMITEARCRSGGAAPRAAFCVGDAHALPFPTATFDACRCERVLQHLPDPARAVAELVRVTRPAGRVVVFEPDWDTLVLDHPDHALTRRLLAARAGMLPSPRAGRQLPRLCAAAGLTRLTVQPVPITMSLAVDGPAATGALLDLLRLPEVVDRAVHGGLAGRVEAERWAAEVTAAAASGALFAAMTGFLVAGARPG